jgi:hypothetical protein
MQCKKKKRDGSQCRAPTLTGEKYCALHSEPGRAALLGSKGGRRRIVYSQDGIEVFPAPKSAADLRDLLAHLIVEIRSGKLDPKLANSISYLGAGFLRSRGLRPGEAVRSARTGTEIRGNTVKGKGRRH